MRMRYGKGCALALALLGILWVPAHAENTPHADAFLLLPVSAREVGLGQATLPIVDDATAFHWNPAGIGMVERFDAAASYARLYTGLANHQMMAAAAPIGYEGVSVGIGWVRLGVDDIPRYPSLPQLERDRIRIAQAGAIGEFNYAQNAVFFTVARRSDFVFSMGWQYLELPITLALGSTVKYLTLSASDSSAVEGSGIGLDLGAQAHFELSRAIDNERLGRVSLGVTGVNVGSTKITWNTATERSDVQSFGIGYGIAYTQPIPEIRSAITGTVANHAAGTVWGLEYMFADLISLRAGSDLSDSTSIAFGVGLGWRGLHFDYGLQRHTLGASHRMSVRYSL